jgi:transcriptional regulator with XRE-family HTH domain
MFIGDRIRAIREAKKLSQGDIEERSGLLRSYLSRVENGHTVPSVETLEKLARALEVPLYQLFYEGEQPPKFSHLAKRMTAAEIAYGTSPKEVRILGKFCRLLARITESDRKLLFHMAQKMARR